MTPKKDGIARRQPALAAESEFNNLPEVA
jgi:hypothetical protein